MKLSTSEVASLAELWQSLKSYIPVKDRSAAAEHFLSAVEDNGFCDLEEVAVEMYGVCSILDRALKEYAPAEDSDYNYDDEYDEW